METTSQTLDMVFPPSDVFPVGRVFIVFICMKELTVIRGLRWYSRHIIGTPVPGFLRTSSSD